MFDPMEDPGALIDALIEAKGLRTQAELARASGIDDGQLSRWRNDRGKPRESSLRLLVSGVGLKPEDFGLRERSRVVTESDSHQPDWASAMEARIMAQLVKIYEAIGGAA